MKNEQNNLIRNILAIGGLILIFLVPYFYANDTTSLVPAILLLLFFIPTFFLYSSTDERKFILAVLFIAAIAEGMNVGFGAYNYLGTDEVPQWVLIGWCCTAWSLLNLNKMINPNKDRNKILAVIIALFAIYAIFISHSLTGFLLNSIIVSAIMFATETKSYNIFLIAVAFGMVIEFSGVFLFGAWSYTVGPDLSNLGAMYTFVYFIGSLISKYEL
ncbi:MAG: hypothetical protein Q7S22_03440 [Candidatus Micrarchaeota archaeon]|nr:hypothetical protein [Candidatus Micrarchaeota archaeon]